MEDIDTDQIIPARFLTTTTKTGLGRHLFSYWRYNPDGSDKTEFVLNTSNVADCQILVAGNNFGGGSSREHAPQALMRFGFRAFVGGSFAEIFHGNCVALGLPCATLDEEDLALLMDAVELDPSHTLVLDLHDQTVTSRAGTHAIHIHPGAHSQLTAGTWNATSVLLGAGEEIDATAARLPYMSGFSS